MLFRLPVVLACFICLSLVGCDNSEQSQLVSAPGVTVTEPDPVNGGSTGDGDPGGEQGNDGSNSDGGTTDPEPEPDPNPNLATAMISSAGGTVTSTDGLISLAVPSDALTNETEIGIEVIDEAIAIDEIELAVGASVTEGELAGTFYRFTPVGQQFDKPLTVSLNRSTIGAAPQDIPTAFTLSNGQIDMLSGGTSIGENLSYEVSHFSLFFIAAEENLSASATPDPTALAVGESGNIATRITGTEFDTTSAKALAQIFFTLNEGDHRYLSLKAGTTFSVTALTSSNPEVVSVVTDLSLLTATSTEHVRTSNLDLPGAFTCLKVGTASLNMRLRLESESGLFIATHQVGIEGTQDGVSRTYTEIDENLRPTYVNFEIDAGEVSCVEGKLATRLIELPEDIRAPEAITVLGNLLGAEILALVAGTPGSSVGPTIAALDLACDAECIHSSFPLADDTPKFDALILSGTNTSDEVVYEVIGTGNGRCFLGLDNLGAVLPDSSGCQLSGFYTDANYWQGRQDASWRVERNRFVFSSFDNVLGFVTDIQPAYQAETGEGFLTGTVSNNGEEFLIATDQGELLHVERTTNSDAPFSILGRQPLAGTDSRRLRCDATSNICGLSDFTNNTLQLFQWVPGSAPVIGGTVSIPGGPIGIDINGNKLVATGFSNNTIYQVLLNQETPLNTDAAQVISIDLSNIAEVSACTNPGHAAFLPDGGVVVSCNGSNHVARVSADEFDSGSE